MNVTPITLLTQSHTLTLDETLKRLAAAEMVDGLALFGSRTVDPNNPISDYDLLVLVKNPSVFIFQMLTHIDGRMTDVVFIETDIADKLLTQRDLVNPTSVEGMLTLKMREGHIVYDASGRLERVQQQVQTGNWLLPTSASALYADWFWQNHTLLHVKRMAQSADPVYLTAVEMMLLTGLSTICRVYYHTRHLPWQGEKAAVRYLQAHDEDYLNLFRACLAETDQKRKVSLYEQLVIQTLAPLGPIWTPGITAVYLRDSALQPAQVDEALSFWEMLLEAH